MANSKYEYVRNYEDACDPILLRNCYTVVRVDGRSFHKFTKLHKFYKPNDKRCLDLMAKAAQYVMSEFYPDIPIAYGQSDEFSFIFRRSSEVFNRRQNKITTLVVSSFTSAFVYNWTKYFECSSTGDDQDEQNNVRLLYPPTFDGRSVLYPSKADLLDYIRWRQVDCHINNLYNTTFYALTGDHLRYQRGQDDSGNEALTVTSTKSVRKDGLKALSPQEAEEKLRGSVSSDKNELLFAEYGINYNDELEQFKKGTLIVLPELTDEMKRELKKKHSKSSYGPRQINYRILHTNVIDDKFWNDNEYLLD